jgi:hypothetical protein
MNDSDWGPDMTPFIRSDILLRFTQTLVAFLGVLGVIEIYRRRGAARGASH